MWQVETPRPLLAGDSQAFTPAVGADAIFFCGGYSYDADVQLVAISAADGKPRWRFHLESCGGSPVLADGSVIAIAREAHSPRVVVYGIDAATGSEEWRTAVGEITAHASLGGSLFVAPAEGGLQRLDLSNGHQTAVPIDSPDRLWMRTADDQLFIGSGASVWRVDGEARPVLVRRLQSRVEPVIAAAIENSTLVLQDRNNGLTAFNRSTGAVLWARRWNRLLSAPAIGGGRVFINTFGPHRYELQAIDAASGGDLWSVQDGGFDAPTLSEGRLYAAGRSSVLVIDPATGVVISEIKSRLEVITSPLMWRDQVLFGTLDGVLHAARPSVSARQSLATR